MSKYQNFLLDENSIFLLALEIIAFEFKVSVSTSKNSAALVRLGVFKTQMILGLFPLSQPHLWVMLPCSTREGVWQASSWKLKLSLPFSKRTISNFNIPSLKETHPIVLDCMKANVECIMAVIFTSSVRAVTQHLAQCH